MTPDEYRIGDAERDSAVEQLREHHAAGRLDVTEFSERLDAALAARTRGDLNVLFTDLPSNWDGTGQLPDALPARVPASQEVAGYKVSVPLSPSAPKGQMTTAQKVALGVQGALWPAALIAQFATGFDHWWLWFLPLVFMPLLAAFTGEDDD